MIRAILLLPLLAAPVAAVAADDWVTPAEKSGFASTPSYAETHAYLERLAAAAPERIHLTRFGVSPEGRDLMLVIASSGGETTPEAARASGKQILFVQAGIHAGEIEGKDAGLMLLRDLSIATKRPHALDHTILLYAPLFNVDGHENRSAYNRINQNGPAEMGFRATAENLNLNRDYMKADAPEMRAWLQLWNAWLPDLLVDVHTTDGADYQYDLTWWTEDWGPLDDGVKAWQERALKQRVFAQMEKHGHLLSPYLELKDHRDITKGIVNFGSGPRFSTGYVALQNRAVLLVETHMLKSYAIRVRATYDLLALILDELDAHPGELRNAVLAADRDAVARARAADASLPILFATSDQSQPLKLKGFAFSQTPSAVSGDTWTQYEPAKPRTYVVPYWRDLVATERAALPAAYLVPAGWPAIIDKLHAHGLRTEATTRPVSAQVRATWLREPQWARRPFEGRIMLTEFKAETARETQTFAPGAVIVALDQRAANVVVNLLEPRAPDSLLRWGFFNAAFEQKEEPDARVSERLARDMLAADPGLKKEFETRLSSDKAFAADAEARLAFFYERSPWYAVEHVGRYPVVALDAAALAAVRAAR
ncbi:MAG: M14 family metallopeptidase [Rudaea sp.]